jgi:tellurite resistance-related uncharacterized protein
MPKILIKEGFSADLDLGNIRTGTYELVKTMGRGPARNDVPEPAYILDGLTVSEKRVNDYIAINLAEIINEVKQEAKPMTTLPQVSSMDVVTPYADPKKEVDRAHQMAKVLQDVVKQAGLSRKFGGQKEHLFFEAWQTIGRFFNVTPSTEWSKPIVAGDKIIGWEARAIVTNANGQVVAAAESMCAGDEPNWKGKAQYAIRSMAQTRASSKALRQAFAWVAVLAGYSATPAEEMDAEFTKGVATPPPAPKAESKAPAESKPIPTEAEVAEFIPSAILMKEGETKGKPWTRHTILEGETKYVTFNKSFAQLAKDANIAGKPVKVWFKTGKYGNDIELLVDPLAQREPGSDDDNYPG